MVVELGVVLPKRDRDMQFSSSADILDDVLSIHRAPSSLKASSRVLPCEIHPGSDGTCATKIPSSSGSTRTLNFIAPPTGTLSMNNNIYPGARVLIEYASPRNVSLQFSEFDTGLSTHFMEKSSAFGKA